MLNATQHNDTLNLLMTHLKGDAAMKGKVYHNSAHCQLCKAGDRNTICHAHHYIQIGLTYLRPKPFKVTGREKGVPFKDGIEAWIYLKEVQAAIADKSFVPWNYRGKVDSITLFGNFFEKYKDRYRTYQRHFLPLWDKDLDQIDRIVVKQFYRSLDPTLAQSSRNLILRILKATLAEAFQEGLIDAIPAFPVKAQAVTREKHWLTREDQEKVLEALPPQYRLIFRFMAYHGKRVSEALSLRWEDLDLQHKAIRVYERKVKQERLMPLHSSFIASLPVAGTINKTGHVFYQWAHRTLNNVLAAACHKAGVKRVTTHEYGRHSFISQKINSGLWSREQVALLTNNLHNIGSYSHLDIEMARRVIES